MKSCVINLLEGDSSIDCCYQ